jgi:hypothetical protein
MSYALKDDQWVAGKVQGRGRFLKCGTFGL